VPRATPFTRPDIEQQPKPMTKPENGAAAGSVRGQARVTQLSEQLIEQAIEVIGNANRSPARVRQLIEQAIEAIGDAHRTGYEDGYRKGFDEGRKAGKRLAKGKSAFAKQRGGQKILNDIWALQFVDFVDEHVAADDITVDAAVDMYRDMMARHGKEHGFAKRYFASRKVFELDKSKGRTKLIRLYWRIKKGEHKIEAPNREDYSRLKRFYSSA
jgi:hypothetical protein